MDGLEYYYAGNGKLIAKYGTDATIRVINEKDIEIASKRLLNPGMVDKGYFQHYLPDVGSKKYSEADVKAQENIARSIHSEIKTYDISGVIVGGKVCNNTTKVASIGSAAILEVCTGEQDKYNEIFVDNYYNLVNVLYHEERHNIGFKTGIKGGYGDDVSHFNIAMLQMQHWSYQNTTKNFKDFIKSISTIYLDDFSKFIAGECHMSEDPFKKLNSPEIQSYINTYNKNVQRYNAAFGLTKKPTNFEKNLKEK